MAFGFLFTYAFIWFSFDLPVTNWAGVLLVALAILTVYGFYKWLCMDEKKTEVRDTHWATEQAYKNGYAKGVKEFAERLKEKVYSKADEVLYAYEIDNLAKEMVGDDK